MNDAPVPPISLTRSYLSMGYLFKSVAVPFDTDMLSVNTIHDCALPAAEVSVKVRVIYTLLYFYGITRPKIHMYFTKMLPTLEDAVGIVNNLPR